MIQPDLLPGPYRFTKPYDYKQIQFDIERCIDGKPSKIHDIEIGKVNKVKVKKRTLGILFSALYHLEEDAECIFEPLMPLPTEKLGYQFHFECYTTLCVCMILLSTYALWKRNSYALLFLFTSLCILYQAIVF